MFFRKNFLSISWSVFILAATLFPGKKLKYSPILGIDKLVHLFLFAVLMYLILREYYKNKYYTVPPGPFAQLAFLVCTIFGILTEIFQHFSPSRTFSLYDWVADILGVLVGYFVFTYFSKK